jgi:phosphatidate phosphatase APP1
MRSNDALAARLASSDIKMNERLVLFPAAAAMGANGTFWRVPIHAWVSVPEKSRIRLASVRALLEARYGLKTEPASEPHLEDTVNLLLADNKRGRTVVVEIAGTQYTLPPTAPNGHAFLEVQVPVSSVPHASKSATIRAVFSPGDPRQASAPVHFLEPKGLSIISDIDDTVKITHVTDRKRMWEATFFKPFMAVPDMASAYQRLTASGSVGVHYVSSSPWHFGATLQDFLARNGFPLSSLSLKHIRLKDRTALNILSPGRVTKPPMIAEILARYPQRMFILIGDSGEDDPEVYAAAYRANADRIVHIAIRNVTGAHRTDARYSKVFSGIPVERWRLFDDPADIAP